MRATSGDNLLLKRGAFYFRRRVPNDLREVIGESDLTAPLGTKNKRVAVRLSRAYAARLELAFEKLRSADVDELDDARAWVRSFAGVAMKALQRGIDAALQDSLRTDEGDRQAELHAEIGSIHAEGVDADEDDALRAVISGVGNVDPDLLPRETWRPLAIGYLKGIEGLRFTTPPPTVAPAPATVSELSNGALAATLEKMGAKLEGIGKAKNPKTIFEALELYAVLRAGDDRIKASSVKDVKTSQEYRLVLRFVEAIGTDKPMDDITSVDLVKYLDGLVDRRLTRGAAPAPPISSGTRRRVVAQLAAFWNVASEQDWCSKNVAKSVARSTSAGKQKRRAAGEQDRAAFPVEALPLIFSAELKSKYGQPGSKYAERFWIPALYLSNGLRAEESAQARLGDLKMVDNIRCFHVQITDSATQTLKNLNSARLIPLHPVLNRLGFDEYVSARRAAVEAEGGDVEAALLFGGLKPSKTHGYKNALCLWINGRNGYLDRLRLWKRTTQVLHSLRFNAIGAMIEAGIPTEFRMALSGHGAPPSDEGVRTYASTRSVVGMYEHLSRIDWDSAFKNVLP